LGPGCTPAYRGFEREARAAGLERSQVQGLGFQHAVFRHPDRPAARETLHVYLEGDGTPFIRPTLPAADPTPRHPIIPTLMALDPAPSLLLGRPCYHGLAASPGCEPGLWTRARYSEAVVASMAAALARIVPPGGDLVLIGYSGGGALAVLLARRVPQVPAVVTLAGNLDTDAWTRQHGYSPLTGSLNPIAGPPLSGATMQLHFGGRQDREVPPELLRNAVTRLGGRLTLLPDTSHYSGWVRHWPAILSDLEGLSGRGDLPIEPRPVAGGRSGRGADRAGAG
jgi:hypothetical protein